MLLLTYLHCKNHVLLSVIQLPQGWPCLRTFELAVPFTGYALYPSFGLSDSFFMTQLKCLLLREAVHECLSNIDHHLASVTLYHLVSLIRLSEQSLPLSAITFFICMLFALLSLLLSHQINESSVWAGIFPVFIQATAQWPRQCLIHIRHLISTCGAMLSLLSYTPRWWSAGLGKGGLSCTFHTAHCSRHLSFCVLSGRGSSGRYL